MNPQGATPHDVTRLLQDWSGGDAGASARLMQRVYEELRALARQQLRRERPGHTLQPTALVHEAFLKLVDARRIDWQSRAHFFGIAARVMRQVLVDHAHARNTDRRGGREQKISLDGDFDAPARTASGPVRGQAIDLLALDEALRLFAVSYPRKAEVVEGKFFGGMEAGELAEVLGVSEKTVLRDWAFAKLWLRRKLRDHEEEEEAPPDAG